jgi:2-oxoacid:acceptor oxidoreductase gamma subunit (pyruvate/2-ketoisovalerate family)
MIEIAIHGRGGQGGVTLAKLIASAYFLRGQYVQAFGVYAAERSGAPIQAFVRIDDEEITNHNQILEPDHVIVLDRTLIGPRVVSGLKPGGWLILNSPEGPDAYVAQFPGRRVATVDATGIAVANGLGTRAVPIVNTTILGAVMKVLGLALPDVKGAMDEVGFGGANLSSGQQAFESVRTQQAPGKIEPTARVRVSGRVASILDRDLGGLPTIHTGDWASRQPKRHQLTPPCNDGCPAGNDVRGFVQAAAKKEFDEGLRLILQTSPLPGICGRVCPAPCMEACNRREHDEAVNVREIERYLADHARWPDVTKPKRAEQIAVIGSGPAGLSATYHLARRGYRVTLFEVGAELGGVMRTGIPSYRLPRDVLDREISFIVRHGVEVKTNQTIDRRRLLEMSHQFAAVFVATGLQESRALRLGQDAPGIAVQGIDFLDRARHGQENLIAQRVAVIGGGNTAIDAARSARRLGARSVHILYRRTRAEMPAIKEEIDEALEEGVELSELVAPLRLHEDALGPVLTCQRMRLGEPDASGRRAPVPIESEDSQFEVRCDKVILALGQTPDLSIYPEGSEVRDGLKLAGLTGAPIFAGGDFATNEGTVTAAIGSGRRAALHIHRTLTGEDLFPPAPPEVAGPDRITMHVFAHAPRERGVILPPDVRRGSFTEVRLGLLDEPGRPAATIEANRCLSCGVCNECDRCLSYCPEGIMVHRGSGNYEFDYDYCKGCGICASQCPRGVVYMAEL